MLEKVFLISSFGYAMSRACCQEKAWLVMANRLLPASSTAMAWTCASARSRTSTSLPAGTGASSPLFLPDRKAYQELTEVLSDSGLETYMSTWTGQHVVELHVRQSSNDAYLVLDGPEHEWWAECHNVPRRLLLLDEVPCRSLGERLTGQVIISLNSIERSASESESFTFDARYAFMPSQSLPFSSS